MVVGADRNPIATIFSTILTNRVTENTEHHVVPALIKAGLPVASVEPLLTALSAGNSAAILKVPGVNKNIIGVAAVQVKAAYSNAFTLLFLVTLAFGGIAIIAAWFTPALEDRYTNDVMRRLHKTGKDKQAESVSEKAAIEHNEGA